MILDTSGVFKKFSTINVDNLPISKKAFVDSFRRLYWFFKWAVSACFFPVRISCAVRAFSFCVFVDCATEGFVQIVSVDFEVWAFFVFYWAAVVYAFGAFSWSPFSAYCIVDAFDTKDHYVFHLSKSDDATAIISGCFVGIIFVKYVIKF